MFEKKIKIRNKIGLHSKPATYFIKKANEYKSSIMIYKETECANAKSLLGVLSLGIMGEDEINISANGVDEEQAVEALVEFLEGL